MQPKTVNIDRTAVVIKPMGVDYIMPDIEPPGVEVAVGCRVHANPDKWPNPMYVAYYKKLTAAYGACAVLAWHKNMIVGFLPFIPVECGKNLPACVHYIDEEDMLEVEAFLPVPQKNMSHKVLKTHCLSVKKSMRLKGLGTLMVLYLIDWARINGWERIQGWAFEKSDFGWLPDIMFWEKCGFKRGKARCWDEYITDPGFEYYMEL